ncbi:unnamed protein product [Didymodactylos carnosus]|nr:unnamed protein product [Didymodactylos carnosus]CAF3891843.1 unnamed protein product [Didymodactylos carnosus]
MRAQLYLQLGRTEEASKDFKEAAFWEQQEHVEDTPPATPEPEPSPEQEYIDPKSSRGRLIAAAINDLEGNSEGAMVNLREVAGLSDIETILRGIKVIKEKGGLLTKEDRAILDALHAAERRKKQQEEALKSFQGNVNLKTYYNVFHLQLEAMFSGCKTVASGFVDHTAEGKLGILANGINLFGKLVSFVPGVSEAAAQVIGIAADVVTAIDHEQQTNILKYIANLGSTAALWEVSQSVAQRLTERYRNQLEQIMTLEEAKKAAPITDSIAKRCIVSCSRTKREITKEEEPSDVKEIADYGVFLIIEALQSQIIDQEESLVGQLVRIVCFANERQSLIEKITTRLGVSNKILRWRTGDRCSLHEFYSKPNILVKDEQGSSGAPVEH